MTEAEATATRTYMIYRFYRRRGDLRAAVLVDLFHHNDKGARQYEKRQQEKPRQGEMNV